jgi:hypothetical protein
VRAFAIKQPTDGTITLVTIRDDEYGAWDAAYRIDQHLNFYEFIYATEIEPFRLRMEMEGYTCVEVEITEVEKGTE